MTLHYPLEAAKGIGAEVEGPERSFWGFKMVFLCIPGWPQTQALPV